MKTDLLSEAKAVSEAKLKANAANAKLSTGPKNTTRSRFNARRHGLSGNPALAGQGVRRNQEFSGDAWARLGPRNPMEATWMTRLLQSRSYQQDFFRVERTVLTRRPLEHPDNEALFPFLDDPQALHTLEAMSRHLAHLTQVTFKSLSELLQVRKESWGEWAPEDPGDYQSPQWNPANQQAAHPSDPPQEKTGVSSQPVPGTLEACLAYRQWLLPGEDEKAFEAMARELWATFRPANTLEGFLATDFVIAQWRLDRVLQIQGIVFERSACSVSGHDHGPGLSFVADTQRLGALESLRLYEKAIRKSIEKVMVLWRKLRKQGWADADGSDTESTQSDPASTQCDSQTAPTNISSESTLNPEAIPQSLSTSPANTIASPATPELDVTKKHAANSQDSSAAGEDAAP